MENLTYYSINYDMLKMFLAMEGLYGNYVVQYNLWHNEQYYS